MWLSLDALGEPVAFIDGEMYDRYAAWDGSDWDHPVVSDVVDAPSMGLTLVVDPARRRRGYGTATLRAVVKHHPGVDPVPVGGDLHGRDPGPIDRSLEEPAGCFGVPAK